MVPFASAGNRDPRSTPHRPIPLRDQANPRYVEPETDSVPSRARPQLPPRFSPFATRASAASTAFAVDDVNQAEKREISNEILILSSLSHPNIIGYHGSFIEGGVLNVVMEYADRGSLVSNQ